MPLVMWRCHLSEDMVRMGLIQSRYIETLNDHFLHISCLSNTLHCEINFDLLRLFLLSLSTYFIITRCSNSGLGTNPSRSYLVSLCRSVLMRKEGKQREGW